MPTFVPFFDKARHQVEKLRAAYPTRPRQASLKLALWSLGKAARGHILGDVAVLRASGGGDELRLAFMLRGGIGDVVINLSWLEALIRLSGVPCRADVFTGASKDCMSALCWNKDYIRRIMSLKQDIPLKDYDAVFDVMQNPQVRAACPERLEKLSSALWDYVRRLLRFQSSHASFYMDENQAMGIHYADVMGTFRRGQADFDASLGLKDSAFTLQSRLGFADVARRFSLRPGYVTLQREAGACAHSLKLWSAVKYASLLERLCREHPSVQFVILGMDKNFDAPDSEHVVDLRGRTDFDEFMALVRHARLHIGCEGVVPHLRHYLRGGPSLVLYGPSCARMLSYPENSALSGTECPNGCEGILFSWQETCLKGYACCRSLEEITVEQVARRVGEMLDTACSAELPERRIPDPRAAGAPTPSAPGDA